MESNELFVQLRSMRNSGGRLLYQRLVIADQLLHDTDWVDSPAKGGGNESLAIERLETECFGDICGAMSLTKMIYVLHSIPDERTWQVNKYNLGLMYRRMLDDKKVTTPSTKTTSKEAAQQKQPVKPPIRQQFEDPNTEKIRELEEALKQAYDRIYDLLDQNKELKKQLSRFTGRKKTA